jgi:hypothetical protein
MRDMLQVTPQNKVNTRVWENHIQMCRYIDVSSPERIAQITSQKSFSIPQKGR